jgi:NAD-dependent DNA ligase
VVTQLAAALRDQGLVVAERVGQSAFRIDAAVRRPSDAEHRVAVLVDHALRVAAQPLAERLLGHPGVLRATGWRLVHVLEKDWLDDPVAVVERVAAAVAADDGAGVDDEIARQVRDELARAAADAPPVPRPVERVASAGTASVPAEAPFASADLESWRRAPLELPPVQAQVSEESLAGMSVCFTGLSVCSIRGVRLSREDQERMAAKAGLDVRQSVSARLDILVLADPESDSTKARRAQELGVRRIAEPVFWRMLGVPID